MDIKTAKILSTAIKHAFSELSFTIFIGLLINGMLR